ncbi:MAG: class I SAM-dependent methyltransferase [Acidobacteriia bacterium]|nr:class I SAM-dependent methyltransferase [Terriglobia bacterium]
MTDEELTAAIQEVQQRARSRVPNGSLGLDGVAAPDLMPLVHARDAAEGKVAAIGTVNPRPPGFKNGIIQRFKRLAARALDWHVREQVEFNRAAMVCVQATLEAMADLNRSIAALTAYHQDLRTSSEEWRAGVEERRAASEIHLLRTVSELQSAFHLRASLIEQNFRESVRQQHDDFTHELDRRTTEIQKRLWDDMEKIRGEYDRLIHTELRLLRQKLSAGPAPSSAPVVSPAPQETPDIDWAAFAEHFRGSEDRIRQQQKCYVARFAGAPGEILDIGCGRGEFLEAAKEAGLPVRGIDQSRESVALCRSKGLDVEQADMFAYLESLADGSLGGAYCAQVVEHLSPAAVPRLVKLLSQKLRLGALVAIETPNPECLAIFATHFYLDPTHTRPVPPPLLRFYLESAGFGSVEIERLTPAVDSMPALADLPPSVRDTFFGGLDYAIVAKKL